MSGTFEQLTVPPTLISFTCNIGDAKTCVSGSFKEVGSKLVYVHIPVDEHKVPNFEVMKTAYDTVYNLAKELITDENAYNKMAKAVNPYGDGFASERIVQAIVDKYCK